MVKRLETSAGVPDPTGPADQHPTTFAIVGAGYGTVCVGTQRLHRRCKPKTDNHDNNRCEHDVSIFHKVFLSPGGLICQILLEPGLCRARERPAGGPSIDEVVCVFIILFFQVVPPSGTVSFVPDRCASTC